MDKGFLKQTVIFHGMEDDELDAALKDCGNKGYTVLDNPICLSCTRFQNECAGSKNHIWTGCAKRIEVTVDG